MPINLPDFQLSLLPRLHQLGKYLKEHRTELSQHTIQGTQYKTKADIYAHSFLTDLLCLFYPAYVLSEESFEEAAEHFSQENLWVLDPIDGSASYCKGYSGYVIQASLILGNTPVFSFIYSPETGSSCYAYHDSDPVFLPTSRSARIPSTSSITLIDNYPKPRGFTAEIVTRLGITNYMECGSFGQKFIHILKGEANLFIKNVPFYIWDVLPAIHLFSRTNSAIVDFDFRPLDQSKIFFDNGLIAVSHAALVDDLNLISIL